MLAEVFFFHKHAQLAVYGKWIADAGDRLIHTKT
jgi:hypothetical protein